MAYQADIIAAFKSISEKLDKCLEEIDASLESSSDPTQPTFSVSMDDPRVQESYFLLGLSTILKKGDPEDIKVNLEEYKSGACEKKLYQEILRKYKAIVTEVEAILEGDLLESITGRTSPSGVGVSRVVARRPSSESTRQFSSSSSLASPLAGGAPPSTPIVRVSRAGSFTAQPQHAFPSPHIFLSAGSSHITPLHLDDNALQAPASYED